MFLRRLLLAMITQVVAITCYADDVEEQLKSYDVACDSLKSYDVDVRLISVSHIPAPHRFEKHVRQRYFEGQFRSDVLRDRNKEFELREKTWIWNGKKEAVILSRDKQVILANRPTGGERLTGIFWQALFREFFPNHSYASLMRQREGTTVSKQDDKIVLFAPTAQRPGLDYGNIAFRLVLDPDQGLMPIRVEQLLEVNGELKPWTVYTNSLKELKPGVWAPASSQCVIYDVNKPSGTAVLAQTDVILNLAESKFNTPIDTSTFEIGEFPNGTIVTDKAKGTIVTLGEKDDK